jgi:hypothetical protein
MPPAVDIMVQGARADITKAVLLGNVFYPYDYFTHFV